MNVVMTRVGPLRRGAGHGRGPAVHPGRARRPARRWPSTASPRSSTPRPTVLATPPPPRPSVSGAAGPRHRQPGQGAGDRRRCSPAFELVPRPADGARRRRGRRHARGQRPAQGAGGGGGDRASRRWPTTPASRSTPSAGAPGVCAARYAGEGATYADNVAKLLARAGRRAAATARARFRTVALARLPDGREVVAEGVVEGTIAAAARGRRRVRLRPGLRPRRRRRPHLRRDDARTRSAPSPTGGGPSPPSGGRWRLISDRAPAHVGCGRRLSPAAAWRAPEECAAPSYRRPGARPPRTGAPP